MHLFGVTLDTLSRAEIVARAQTWLSQKEGFHRIATVNPEFLLRACEEASFRENLRTADLRVVDGFGIVVAGWFSGRHIERFAGADLMEALLNFVEREEYPVYLAVRADGLSHYEDIASVLRTKYPKLIIEGRDLDVSDVPSLNTGSAALLLCNFGAPEQEYFTEGRRAHPGAVRLAIGVGGSFDYLTGKIRRAPVCVQRLGLEWLWRLAQQPSRLRRIWRATGVFLYTFLTHPKT